MRTSTWFGGGARRAPNAALACAVASLGVLGACGELSSSGSGPQATREGQVVSAEGTAELSVKASATAPRVVRAEAPWKATGTVHRGIARLDPVERGLLMRDPARDADGPAGVDPAQGARDALGLLASRMLPALQVRADSRAASFGRTSVVELGLADATSDSVHFVAISDLAKGPLTDYLVVRGNRPVTYQRVDWARRGDEWRVSRVRSYMFGDHGGQVRVDTRVSGDVATRVDSSEEDVARLDGRVVEMQLASLAKRLLLPAAANAQSIGPNVDCEQYRRSGVALGAPSCFAYTMNAAEAAIQPAIDLAARFLPGLSLVALRNAFNAGGAAAIVSLIKETGATLDALIATEWFVPIAAVIGTFVVTYIGTTLADCQTFRKAEVEYCAKRGVLSPGGGGLGPNPEDETGTVGEACSMMCDPTRRGIIDDWRNGIRAAE